MTQREKTLSIGLIGLLVVFGGGFLSYVFVYEPVSAVSAQLATEKEELQKKKNELDDEGKKIEAILHVDPRLSQWAQLSLPPRDPLLKKAGLSAEEQKRKHLADLRVAYARYLQDAMTKAGFARSSIKVDVKSVGRVVSKGKGKEPPYEQLTFGAVGHGKMDAVVRVMQEFYRTPLLHHVRKVSLGLVSEKGGSKKSPGLLELDLTIEALLMKGAQDRTELQPKGIVTPRVLAFDTKRPKSGERNYLAMDRFNMFTGYQAPAEPVSVAESEAAAARTEAKKEVLRFVRLTSLSSDPKRRNRWEACLYDQAKGDLETKLNTTTRDTFTISDKDDHPMLVAKVVKIDEKCLVFLSEGKYYRMKCGDMLWPTVRTPLDKEELKELGITPDESEKEKPKEEEES